MIENCPTNELFDHDVLSLEFRQPFGLQNAPHHIASGVTLLAISTSLRSRRSASPFRRYRPRLTTLDWVSPSEHQSLNPPESRPAWSGCSFSIRHGCSPRTLPFRDGLHSAEFPPILRTEELSSERAWISRIEILPTACQSCLSRSCLRLEGHAPW